eukprot:Gb_19819 [translate_table: standard]
MSGPDALFSLRNNFYIGAYQAAINDSDLPGLAEEESIERDCLVYRSYIALGSYQLVIDEISSSASTSLQAVKLLAMYLAGPAHKDIPLSLCAHSVMLPFPSLQYARSLLLLPVKIRSSFVASVCL